MMRPSEQVTLDNSRIQEEVYHQQNNNSNQLNTSLGQDSHGMKTSARNSSQNWHKGKKISNNKTMVVVNNANSNEVSPFKGGSPSRSQERVDSQDTLPQMNIQNRK